MPDVIFRNVPRPAAINNVAWDRRYAVFDNMDRTLSAIAWQIGISVLLEFDAVPAFRDALAR